MDIQKKKMFSDKNVQTMTATHRVMRIRTMTRAHKLIERERDTKTTAKKQQQPRGRIATLQKSKERKKE